MQTQFKRIILHHLAKWKSHFTYQPRLGPPEIAGQVGPISATQNWGGPGHSC